MARVARLAGAVLVESDDRQRYFLVGNTKRPCDWGAEGFAAPAEIDALKRPWIALARNGNPLQLQPPLLTLTADGPAAAALLAQRFLIERNGAVSDRLWRLVLRPDAGADADAPPAAAAVVDARWFEAMPAAIWQIVRDTVLRCL
jgi:hypothetical protein